MDRESSDINRIADILKMPPPRKLPVNFAERVVTAALDHHPQPGWLDAFWTFWHGIFQPRPVLLRPAWQIAWAVVLCIASATTTGWMMHNRTPENIWVRFAVSAPSARQVALVGDFNAWQPNAIQMEDPNGDGVWHVMVPLKPGIYQYMFVLDGKQWISDPLSSETIDDGFGQKNSLLKVARAQFSTKSIQHAL